MNAAPAIEAEQWRSRVRFGMGGQAPLDLAADQFCDSGAVRTKRLLPNLPPRTTRRLRSVSTSLCTGALGHEALRRRWNHPVFGRDEVPAGLRFPSRLVDRSAECRQPL